MLWVLARGRQSSPSILIADGNFAGQFFLTRIFAGLVFATFLMTGAASASSFVTPEPMTAKLGPSMIALGEPASEPVAAASQPVPDETAAKAIDRTPLEYPFPGGKVPVVRASGKIAIRTPLNYPAPAGDPKPAEAAPSPTDVTFVKISPSIIAMTPEPAVSFEEVAAVGDDAADADASRRDLFGAGPTVIRGGVVNDGAAAASVPAAPAKKQATAQHSPAMGGARPASSYATPQAAASQQAPSKQPDVPIPSPTPAPPPSNIIPEAKIR